MRRLCVAAAAAFMLVVALVFGVPWLTRDRTAYTGTPTPPPYAQATPIVLKPGSRACQQEVAFAADTRRAVVLAGEQLKRGGPPLEVTATAPGWHAAGRIGGGYPASAPLTAALGAPPRSLLATVCVRNAGHRRVSLAGSQEARVAARTITSIDGRQIPAKMTLLLTEGEPRSFLDRAGETLARISAFKPPFIGRVSVALLLLAAFLGIPAAVLYAISRGLRDPD